MTLPSNDRPVFIVDAMLGNIAKKLRLFGFDTKYQANISDEQLVKEAFLQKRILITKDRRLYHKSKKTGISVLLPVRFDETEILAELLKSCQISQIDMLPNSFTRCLICNGSIYSVNKISVINEIPTNVSERMDIFYRCTNCMKVYWNGTHISHINNQIKEINYHLKKSSMII